jgi:hypothetical protein
MRGGGGESARRKILATNGESTFSEIDGLFEEGAVRLS